MKNTKVKIIATIVVVLLATLLFCANSFAAITINFPTQLYNGSGTINVSGSNETINYQAVEMSDTQHATLVELENQKVTDYSNFETAFNEKKAIYDPLKEKVNNGTATQEEYETATRLFAELEAMKSNYLESKAALEQRIENTYPKYNNSNWVEATNGRFTINNTTDHTKYYVLWAKVGNTIDKFVYPILGRGNTTIVTREMSVEIGKTLELTGSDGTDLSTITWTSDDPTIATITDNKINGLKIGTTTIRGTKNGNEVIDISVIVRAPATIDPAKDIPDDAKGYNGHAYYYFSGNKSWDDAKAYCEKIGGHLVTITAEGEEEFVNTLVNSSKAWIGGYKESTWKWVTSEAWSYTDWNTNEPGSDNRVALVSGKWAALDNNSMEVAGFVCEWDDPEGLQPLNPTNPTQPTDPSNPTEPSNPGQTQEPEEQLIYRQDGIGGSTTNPNSTSGDQTIATKKIPQTGESIVGLVALVVVAGVSVVLFVNYRKNK